MLCIWQLRKATRPDNPVCCMSVGKKDTVFCRLQIYKRQFQALEEIAEVRDGWWIERIDQGSASLLALHTYLCSKNKAIL